MFLVFVMVLNVVLALTGIYRLDAGTGTDLTAWLTGANVLAAVLCAFVIGSRVDDL